MTLLYVMSFGWISTHVHRSALAFVGGVTLAVFHYSCRVKFCGIKASVHKADTKHRTC